MQRTKVNEKDLQRVLKELQEQFPKLAIDEVFVLWFLRAYLTEDENEAASSLCGGPGDKGVDAVLIDGATKVVSIIQGKYRKGVAELPETEAVIIQFGREMFRNKKVTSETFACALKIFGPKRLVDLVALMANYSATAVRFYAFDMQVDPDKKLLLPLP